VDEKPGPQSSGNPSGESIRLIYLSIAAVSAVGVGILLGEVCRQLQLLNDALSKVFLTFPLSLQELKGIEAQIEGSSRDEAGPENLSSPEGY
jgi:hypothetical protein